MLSQLRGELLKLATVRTTWVFALGTSLLIVLVVTLQAATAGGELMGPLDDAATQSALFTSSTVSPIIAIVFGTLGLATELRHHTIVSTLLVDASRVRVVAAKGVAALIAGAVLGAVAVLVAAVAAALALAVTSTAPTVAAADVAVAGLGTIAAASLGALFGLGVGGVLRNQALAVGVVLLVLLAVEPLAGSLLPAVATWLPSSLTTIVAEAGAGTDTSRWAAASALAGYGVVATAAAAVTLRRIDLT